MSECHFESSLSEILLKYPSEEQSNILQYSKQFKEIEKKAFLIAKTHLGTSFNILRSTGYLEWKKKEKEL